jgi:hypothetical protein
MANPVESVRKMTTLASGALNGPGHLHAQALREILREGTAVLVDMGEQQPLDDVQVWGAEHPTESSRR